MRYPAQIAVLTGDQVVLKYGLAHPPWVTGRVLLWHNTKQSQPVTVHHQSVPPHTKTVVKGLDAVVPLCMDRLPA